MSLLGRLEHGPQYWDGASQLTRSPAAAVADEPDPVGRDKRPAWMQRRVKPNDRRAVVDLTGQITDHR